MEINTRAPVGAPRANHKNGTQFRKRIKSWERTKHLKRQRNLLEHFFGDVEGTFDGDISSSSIEKDADVE